MCVCVRVCSIVKTRSLAYVSIMNYCVFINKRHKDYIKENCLREVSSAFQPPMLFSSTNYTFQSSKKDVLLHVYFQENITLVLQQGGINK